MDGQLGVRQSYSGYDHAIFDKTAYFRIGYRFNIQSFWHKKFCALKVVDARKKLADVFCESIDSQLN